MPKFYCVHCGQHIDADEGFAGMDTKCPTCNGAITVPGVSPAKPPPIKLPPPINVQHPAVKTKSSFSGGKIVSSIGSFLALIIAVSLAKACGSIVGKTAAEKQKSQQRVSYSAMPATPDREISVESILPQVIADLNKRLPINVDRETRLYRVTAGPGRKTTYYYSMINLRVSDLNISEFLPELKSQLIESYRSQEGLKYFRDNEVIIDFHYIDADGKYLTTVSVDPKDL